LEEKWNLAAPGDFEMNAQEMRELDDWIAENVFGSHRHQDKPYREGVRTDAFAMWEGGELDCLVSSFNPTANLALALEVLKKCTEDDDLILMTKVPAGFRLSLKNGKHIVWSETLELAICLFAKKLFTK
jgi:hypothetical protein